jgi:endonuclease-3 related protein
VKFGCTNTWPSSKSNRSKTEILRRLQALYDASLAYFGPLCWWPGDTDFEICVGAILTQNTAWTNVRKAIANLKDRGMLSLRGLLRATPRELAEAVRPAGYYNQKSQRLREFCLHIERRHRGRLGAMMRQPVAELRAELLALKGIGPETADSMILYVARQPVFVVDAYTRRIFSRLGAVGEDIEYQPLQDFFHRVLPPDAEYYGEYHAQLVYVGKNFCRKRNPCCDECPVRLT